MTQVYHPERDSCGQPGGQRDQHALRRIILWRERRARHLVQGVPLPGDLYGSDGLRAVLHPPDDSQ